MSDLVVVVPPYPPILSSRAASILARIAAKAMDEDSRSERSLDEAA